MEEEKPKPKIDYIEGFIAGFFLFALPDIIELALMFFLGDSWFLTDIFFWPAEQLYLYLKGIKGTYVLVGNILELIPFVGDLPIRTISFVLTVIAENNPKIKKVAEVASKVKQPQSNLSNSAPNLGSGNLGARNNLSSNLGGENIMNKNTIPKNLNIDYNNIIENNNIKNSIIYDVGVQQDGAPLKISKGGKISKNDSIKQNYGPEVDDENNIVNLKNA